MMLFHNWIWNCEACFSCVSYILSPVLKTCSLLQKPVNPLGIHVKTSCVQIFLLMGKAQYCQHSSQHYKLGMADNDSEIIMNGWDIKPGGSKSCQHSTTTQHGLVERPKNKNCWKSSYEWVTPNIASTALHNSAWLSGGRSVSSLKWEVSASLSKSSKIEIF